MKKNCITKILFEEDGELLETPDYLLQNHRFNEVDVCVHCGLLAPGILKYMEKNKIDIV